MDFDKVERQEWNFIDFEGWSPSPDPSVGDQPINTVLASNFDACHSELIATRRALEKVLQEKYGLSPDEQIEFADQFVSDARTELAQEARKA